MIRYWKARLFFASLTLIQLFGAALSAEAATVYQSTWASVDQHNPAPEWFKDAKLGIYFHWGVYSVAAYGNEWYPRRMYDNGSVSGTVDACYTHHVSAYGDPKTVWPYHNFINGANDKSGVWTQFAPKLKSQGGNFDPDSFAAMISNAGAWFAGPVAEHHDGFSMWNSTCNEWNAVKKGPKLDCVKLLTDAFRKKNMKIITTFHTAFNFTGYYQYAPAQTDTSLKKLYGQLGTTVENQLWYTKIQEVIDQYQPDIIWHDFNVRAVNSTQVLNSLAYYYNKAIDWNKEVVVGFKDGMDTLGQVFDFERNMPANLCPSYWMADDGVSGSSWSYRTGMSFYSDTGVLHYFIDRVSKNGNLLLNFGPMADGTIPSQVKTIMASLGNWLGKYGEAIYCTRAWTVYGEGPTKIGNETYNVINNKYLNPKAATAQDIRYTRSKDTTNLFAIFLGWPGNGAKVTLASVTTARFLLGSAAKVYLYGTTTGNYTTLTYTQSNTGLVVTMPAAKPYEALAYALKISKTGDTPKAPPAKPWAQVALRSDKHNQSVSPAVAGVNTPGDRLVRIGGTLSRPEISVPGNATGLELYSLQGKLIFRHVFTGKQRVYRFEDLTGTAPAELYVKILTE
jgi:alpha-L-fucosidase